MLDRGVPQRAQSGPIDFRPNVSYLQVCPDNPHNTPVYFLGRYDPKTLKFDMENASGGVQQEEGFKAFRGVD